MFSSCILSLSRLLCFVFNAFVLGLWFDAICCRSGRSMKSFGTLSAYGPDNKTDESIKISDVVFLSRVYLAIIP